MSIELNVLILSNKLPIVKTEIVINFLFNFGNWIMIVHLLTIYSYPINLPLMIKHIKVNTACKFRPIRCKPPNMAVWNNFVRVLDFLQVFKRTGSLFWSLLALAKFSFSLFFDALSTKTKKSLS